MQAPMFPASPPESSERLSAPEAAARRAQQRRAWHEQRRRRPRAVRAKTENMLRLSKRELEVVSRELDALDETEPLPPRPRTRADCLDGPRPCPWVSCKHHLFLDVNESTGSIKLNFPDVDAGDLERLAETCALDVAARDGATLEEVGSLTNLTRERVRQIEVIGLSKIKRSITRDGEMMEHAVGGGRHEAGVRERHVAKRRLPMLQPRDFDAEEFASDDLSDDE